jgi:hypothetical protein
MLTACPDSLRSVERMSSRLDSLRRRGPRLLIVLAVACVVLVALLYLVLNCTARGQRIDDAAVKGRVAIDAEGVGEANRLLRTIDVASVALVGGTIMVVALTRRRPRLAIAAGAVILGANVTTQLLKDVLPRPDLIPGPDPLKPYNIFPSGHSTVAMSLALAAVLVASLRVRGIVAVIGALYAAAIGVATLTAGWHRPSDAIGGFAVVTAWACVAAWWDRREAAPAAAESEQPAPVATPALVVIGAVLALLAFAIFVLVVVARRLGNLDAVPLGAPYRSAAFAISGAALVLVGAVLFALRAAAMRPESPVPYADAP